MEFDSRFEGSRLERPPRLYVKRAQEGLDEPEGIWGEMRDGAFLWNEMVLYVEVLVKVDKQGRVILPKDVRRLLG
jgi:hypothetical protein